MATKLDNKVVRESSLLVDEREIVITLTEDQTIDLKLKGMKSGTVSIGIRELWYQLNNEDIFDGSKVTVANIDDVWEEEQPKTKVKIAKDYPGELMVSLNRLRSLNAITHSDLAVTIKLDEIIVDLLKGGK